MHLIILDNMLSNIISNIMNIMLIGLKNKQWDLVEL